MSFRFYATEASLKLMEEYEIMYVVLTWQETLSSKSISDVFKKRDVIDIHLHLFLRAITFFFLIGT